MSRFETQAVHAGREDFAALGIHAPPIDLSSTYPVADLDAGTASFDALVAGEGHAANSIYARLHNPTVARTEQAVATLEGTEACVAFGSGMADRKSTRLNLQSLMRISYAVFCLKKKTDNNHIQHQNTSTE